MSLLPDFLARLPEIVAERIHGILPGLETCEAIEGDFDTKELKRVSKRAPAVLVAALGMTQRLKVSWAQGEMGVAMAAFVMTKPGRDLPARESAWAITQALAAMIPEQTWDLCDCGPAERIEQRVHVTQETRAAQVHLSSISWVQPVVLRPVGDVAPIPLALYVTQSPIVVPEDAYELVEGDDV